MGLFLKYWTPPILWAGLIFMFSTGGYSSEHTSSFLLPFFQWLAPHASLELLMGLQVLVRKLAHWAEYFVLAVLLYRAFRGRETRSWQMRWAFWTLVLVLFYALADESHQALVPNRNSSIQDSLLDFFGGTCAIGLLYIRHRIQSKAALLPVNAAE